MLKPLSTSHDLETTLQITLPRSVKRRIALVAAERNQTIRAIVLRALKASGISIPERQIVDRRSKR